ncbi:MAG: FHA domain-containing protein [Deltaproteobacteria bacterium]|nr:FHA domain-containing protein [Deltaproteobacteria bacterium]
MHTCRAGDRFEVGDGPIDLQFDSVVVLGRGERSDVVDEEGIRRIEVDDAWMSSGHARLIRFIPKDGAEESGSPPSRRGMWIEDLGSTNGVLVNGDRVRRRLLRPYDVIETGRTFWVYLEERPTREVAKDPVELGSWAMLQQKRIHSCTAKRE